MLFLFGIQIGYHAISIHDDIVKSHVYSPNSIITNHAHSQSDKLGSMFKHFSVLYSSSVFLNPKPLIRKTQEFK